MTEYVQGPDHPLYFHLFSSSVVAYAKPFVDNKSFGSLPKEWRKFEHPWMSQVHNDAIKARHEVIAHNDDKVRKMWVLPPGAMPPGALAAAANGLSLKIEGYYVGGGFFISLAHLCDYQIYRLNHAVDEELCALYEGQPIPSEEFLLTLDDEF
ncbi:hypothetical protein ACFOPN_07250 [Xanthomonas hyacinthi]|uniref:Uncharacterized protein n=2 Tax=Xanthomonas hyacinthi TaxID=56455 RepID=A0A2S7ET95_9XANT|nr:hypothetical protein Y886_09245 [Xanthomonas hyacinthi DSM 19077]PPU96367.1 hypothetical protein XhyaCFBP1156_15610 [Xanthomonas hyacinthi]